MKVSLKVEYALRVLAQLARYHGTDHLAHIEDLAHIESVPANYLVQILNELRNGGLINSKRGKQGGYALAKDPAQLTIHGVISVIDPGMLESTAAGAGQSGTMVAKHLGEISAAFEAICRQHTIQQLIPKDGGGMYYI